MKTDYILISKDERELFEKEMAEILLTYTIEELGEDLKVTINYVNISQIISLGRLVQLKKDQTILSWKK